MTTKSQRRARKRNKAQPEATDGAEKSSEEQRYHPKQGPGQVFTRDEIPDLGRGYGTTRRYRNVGASPLLLALHQGKLACDAEKRWREKPAGNTPPSIMAADRLRCAEQFEKWWYIKQASPQKDSLNPGIGGGQREDWSENQQRASSSLKFLRESMATRNFLIVQAFCGEGHTMLDALRFAGVEAHPVGTAFRVREALDDLVCVLTGRIAVPILVPADTKRA